MKLNSHKKNIWIYSIILNLYWVSIKVYNYQQKHLDIGMLCCVLVKFWISFWICSKLIDRKIFMQQKSNSWMQLRCLFRNAAIFINKLTSLIFILTRSLLFTIIDNGKFQTINIDYIQVSNERRICLIDIKTFYF